ncbi:aminotransferase-like domain-containing protein [Rubrivivax gelatinosus]|uniref:Transcriptional regulator, GntR family with aminotransferase domain n=1 Tax=Rubrivivax gelatinosus (strain NBRC 100245 / IL144) TaxID=983917 RepID=I0HUZ5_RUBGI|nr:PLP-dependent aminotransferase family protein [Rubrivivax gelatinosus]BAL96832.1 transcriptional regulator, GntR family with aminotransferase domain [Rubrivivax gelatinosus IL144]
MFAIQPESSTPLVTQIVEGFRRLIAEQVLKPGAKLPSIRAFAAMHSVSVFTVVEAYDRLVAQGWLVSRSNEGFFVKRRADAAPLEGPSTDLSFDHRWYLQQIFESRTLVVKAGCGWLPNDWLFEDGVRRSLRQLASDGAELGGYGLPHGHLALRVMLAETMAERQIVAGAQNVLLTQGSSQALDLAARHLLKPGDAALVDDPGYPNLMYMLRILGVRLVPVPRTPGGYDLPALEAAIAAHAPKAFFTQPRLQSPTNSIAPLAQLHRVLQLAEAHGLTIVENDIYADLDPEPRPSLASLDQLRRVIHVGSYSKTISPNIRVGFLLGGEDLLRDLAGLKMIAGLTSSDLTERLAFGALVEGRWRKHLKSLRDRLAAAHGVVGQRLLQLGFELFSEPKAGLYLWARHPDLLDGAELSRAAAAHGIMLGPGELFLVDRRPTGWMRFNVAFSNDERLWRFLGEQIDARLRSAAGD